MHTRIILVEKPLLGHHLRPFQLQILYSMGSRKRPGVNPHSLATAAATEAMRIAVRTVSWRIRWRAPCLLKNSVSLQKTQALVPVGSFHCFYYFCKAFAVGVEVSHPCYPKLCGGGGQHMTGSSRVYRSTAEFPVKTSLIKLVHDTYSFIFYFIKKLQKSKCREL